MRTDADGWVGSPNHRQSIIISAGNNYCMVTSSSSASPCLGDDCKRKRCRQYRSRNEKSLTIFVYVRMSIPVMYVIGFALSALRVVRERPPSGAPGLPNSSTILGVGQANVSDVGS